MTEQTTRQKWKAGVELAERLNSEFRTGRATRPALEVERYLAMCRGCECFRANDCSEIDLHAEGPNYHQLLTREDLFCRRWTATAPVYSTLQQSASDCTAEDAQRRTDELLGRIARMHDEGTRRTQDERRKLRNEHARRRRQRKRMQNDE